MDYTKFLDEVKRTRRPATYRNYQFALKKFPDGTEDEIIDYIEKSSDKGSTKRANLRVLRIALGYYGELTKGISRIIRSYKPDESLQECPTDEQIEIIWDTLEKPRDRAMFALMAYMGLRVGEVARLNLEDITEDNRLILRKTKGHRPDVLPILHSRVLGSLRAYLHGTTFARMASDQHALFTTTHGRMSLVRIKGLFREVFQRAGMPQFHCHSLRRYFANSMYSHGVSLVDMQINMRHSSPATTMRYLNLGQQNKIDAMRKTWGKAAMGGVSRCLSGTSY